MLNGRSKKIRIDAIKLSQENGGYHYGSSFSCAEILINLYDSILKKEDRLVFSKGHGCWCFYALLKEQGYSPILEGHPYYDPKNGVFSTSGSLGHGLPMAMGMALAKRLKNELGHVYVILGDGECQEGTTWESILIASKLNLTNLTAIVDNNELQGSDFIKNILPSSTNTLICAATAAGWNVKIIDGHNSELLDIVKEKVEKPNLIIANTIKGKGISFMENNTKWHAQGLTPILQTQAFKELT